MGSRARLERDQEAIFEAVKSQPDDDASGGDTQDVEVFQEADFDGLFGPVDSDDSETTDEDEGDRSTLTVVK